MGYSYRNGGRIVDFWPDETDDQFYIVEHASLADILERAKEKWGEDISLEEINVESLYIHTSCLTYDAYDSSDYTKFLGVYRANTD